MVKGKLSEDDVIAEALENIQSAERASGIEPVALEDPIKETLTKSFLVILQTVMKEV
jgi:hypothetical protein